MNLSATLRTVTGLGAVGPVAFGGIVVGAATKSERNVVNFFSAVWPKLVLTLGGVRMNIHGARNLTSDRPAVFIFNHRNNFDVFVAAALVRDNWTAVGKKELQNDPIAGTIGRIVDAAFIDRDDRAAAVEGLRKVEQLARNGLSIVISPEGTRTAAATVGEFKKGPFRIAMSAGIPIVPIVIRNAEVIAGQDGSVIHAGTVDVAVLRPISVAHWTVKTLDQRIAEVRNLYVDALTTWPAATTGASRPAEGSP